MARDLQVVDLSRVKNVCKKKKLREFHLKLLHRIVGTKKIYFLLLYRIKHAVFNYAKSLTQ